jgi:hypothetical protein
MHYYLDDGGYYLGRITPFMAILPIYYTGTRYVLLRSIQMCPPLLNRIRQIGTNTSTDITRRN